LIVSALPMGCDRTLVKCVYIDEGYGTHAGTVKDLAVKEIKSTIATLRTLQQASTKLDFQQSAVRERLDKFTRHIIYHKRLEDVAGKEVNPVMRTTPSCKEDEEAQSLCSALENAAHGAPQGCPAENRLELEW
jgi:hypothetical protein